MSSDPSSADWDPSKVTVLVADDEEIVRSVTVRILQRMGYQVVSAVDGTEAVARFRAEPERIDLIFVDMSMPGLDGAQTIQAIRESRPDVPAVVSSGWSEQEAIDKCEPSSRLGFLGKPYTPDELAACVRRALA